MYSKHFGLDRRPFAITPDPSLLIWTEQHAHVLEILVQEALSHAPLTLLTGDIGCGKTTLLHALLEHPRIEAECRPALISVRVGSAGELFQHLARAVGDVALPLSEESARRTLERWLSTCAADGKTPLLILDEAQTMSTDAALFLARLAVGTETRARAPAILLSGQPELASFVNKPSLRSLKARVGKRLRLGRLGKDQVGAYVQHRLKAAGYRDDSLFDPEAIAVIHGFSRGAPRLINKLCDLCLHTADQQKRARIDGEFVRQVLAQFELVGGAAPSQAPAGEGLIDSFVVSMSSRRHVDKKPEIQPSTEARAGMVAANASAPPPAGVPTLDAAAGGIAQPKPKARIRKRATLLGAFAAAVCAVPILLLLPRPEGPGPGTAPLPATAVVDTSGVLAETGMALAAAQKIAPVETGAETQDALAEAVAPPARTMVDLVPEPVALEGGQAGASLVAAVAEAVETRAAPVGTGSGIELVPLPTSAAPQDGQTFFRAALDSSDPQETAINFARAALRGHERSAVFLGQLYETGDGLIFAPDIAQRWYAMTADPRGRAAGAELDPVGEGQQSVSLLRAITEEGTGEFIWQGRAARFTVELADAEGVLLAHVETPLTALRVTLPDGALRWRVVTDGGARSDWGTLEASGE